MSKHSLRLGGGKWAAKEDKILAYAEGDISGKFLPHEMDFSRGTDIGATRINKQGLIEKARENILLRSNSFDTFWTTSNSPTLTSGHSGYDGNSDAWEIGLTANYGQIVQTRTVPKISTFSIYVKAGTAGFVRLRIDATTNAIADFDLSDGSVAHSEGNIINTDSEELSNGWWRIQMASETASGTTLRVYPAVAANDLTGTSGTIYVQDAQLERGVVASGYIESDGTAGKAGLSEDMPRIDYKNGEARLLLEDTRKNELAISEYFPDSQGTRVTVTNNTSDTKSPEGVYNATKMMDEATGDANHTHVLETLETVATLDDASEYTVSAFVKDNGRDVGLNLSSGTGLDTHASFNIKDGYVRSNGSFDKARIEELDNGWFRIIAVGTTTAASATKVFIRNLEREDNGDVSYLGDATKGIYFYGLQLEKGESATSYIPTYGAAATRNFDEIEMISNQSTDGVMGNYNTTFYMEVELNGGTTNDLARFITLENADNDQDPRVLLYADPEANEDTWELKLQYRANGAGSPADVYVNKTGYNYNEKVKILGRIDGTEMATFANGLKNGTATITTQDDIEDIDFSNLSTDQNHHISDIQIFPFSMTDLDCEILTTKTTFNNFADMSETLNYNS